MTYPATEWFEISQYDDKRSITVANVVEQEWLARYPWPVRVRVRVRVRVLLLLIWGGGKIGLRQGLKKPLTCNYL